MRCESFLTFLLIPLLYAACASASTINFPRRNAPTHLQPRFNHIRAQPSVSALIYTRRSENDILYQHLRRHITRRRPLLIGPPPPKPLTKQQQEEKKKKEEEDKKKQEKEAKERVINKEKKQKEESAKRIEDEHDRADNYITYANEGLDKAETTPPRKGDRTPQQIAQAQKEAALRNEKNKDAGIIKDYKKTTDDLQKGEFNSDGTPKSEARKQADRALAGFLKFLDIFQEVVSALANVFPGAGQVLGVGLRLGSAVGKTFSAIQKIEKGVMKTEKFGEKVTQILDMRPGDQVIPGIVGKEMAAVQEKMINDLIKLANDNTQATEKKIKSNTPTGPPKRPICREEIWQSRNRFGLE